MNYVAIVAAGESLPSDALLCEKLKEVDTVLAVDGGWDVLVRLKVKADLLLGDFDSSAFSVSHPLVQDYVRNKKVLHFPVRKDQTDMELALCYCAQHLAKKVLLFGGVGSRLDHTLINLSMIKRFTEGGMSIVEYSKYNVVRYLVPGVYCLSKPKEDFWYTSFLLFSGEATMTLRGFDYPLESVTLVAGSSLAISNHVLTVDNEVRIESEKGCGVFCVQSRDANGGILSAQ